MTHKVVVYVTDWRRRTPEGNTPINDTKTKKRLTDSYFVTGWRCTVFMSAGKLLSLIGDIYLIDYLSDIGFMADEYSQ